MPHPTWRHECKTGEVVQGTRDCSACGSIAHFDGWRLSMWEAMAVYRYVFDLNPIGPHRPFADQVFTGMRSPCIRCRGRTVLTRGNGTAWCSCPDCEGTGGIWNCSTDAVEAARRDVLARWPGAELTTRSTNGDARVAPSPGRPKPRRTRRRSKGCSTHGLRFADVVRAFALAERILGAEWQLKGRGHCRRASLKALYSSHALKGAARSWTRVRPHQALTWKRLMPVAIIEKAAQLLGVPAPLLISREY
jgi:hypothetical protein